MVTMERRQDFISRELCVLALSDAARSSCCSTQGGAHCIAYANPPSAICHYRAGPLALVRLQISHYQNHHTFLPLLTTQNPFTPSHHFSVRCL
jgi:hypothetical protein